MMIDGSTKNHILLFGLDLGLFLTVTGLFMIYKHPSMVFICVSLAASGVLNILLQVRLDSIFMTEDNFSDIRDFEE